MSSPRAGTNVQPQPQTPNGPTDLNVQRELFRGDNTARVAIIEYSNFECPYCGKYEREASPQIIANYIQTGKVKLFYRDLPLPMHPHALQAARAARCAGGLVRISRDHACVAQSENAPPPLMMTAFDLGAARAGVHVASVHAWVRRLLAYGITSAAGPGGRDPGAGARIGVFTKFSLSRLLACGHAALQLFKPIRTRERE